MLQQASASQIAAATADRDNKLQNLKNKIIWVCCAKSLSPPLQYVGALKYEKNDTEDEKIARRLEHTIKVNEREEERIRREPELLRELEKIMDRVKQARLEYVRPEIDYAASANAHAIVRYYCEKCNNQVCIIVTVFISIVIHHLLPSFTSLEIYWIFQINGEADSRTAK